MSEQKYQVTQLRVGEEIFQVDQKGVKAIEVSPHSYLIHYTDDTIKGIFSPNKDASWKMKPIVIEVPEIVVANAS